LHERTFTDQEAAHRLETEIQAATDEIAEEHRWPEVWAWRLRDVDPRPPAPSDLTPLDPKTFELRASHQEQRLPLVFDGNLDTRWMTEERQAGTEWIEIRLPRLSNVGRLQIVGAGRTVLDYPRHLRIDSADPAGVSRTLFDDRIIDRYVEAVAFDDQHPSIAVDLPQNGTATLRILQTGQALSWWSIHELTIWERTEER
jgi:hypothetical protein